MFSKIFNIWRLGKIWYSWCACWLSTDVERRTVIQDLTKHWAINMIPNLNFRILWTNDYSDTMACQPSWLESIELEQSCTEREAHGSPSGNAGCTTYREQYINIDGIDRKQRDVRNTTFAQQDASYPACTDRQRERGSWQETHRSMQLHLRRSSACCHTRPSFQVLENLQRNEGHKQWRIGFVYQSGWSWTRRERSWWVPWDESQAGVKDGVSRIRTFSIIHRWSVWIPLRLLRKNSGLANVSCG